MILAYIELGLITSKDEWHSTSQFVTILLNIRISSLIIDTAFQIDFCREYILGTPLGLPWQRHIHYNIESDITALL